MTEARCDVAIFGAGPAGAALAAALAGRFRVALVERRVGPAERIGESLPPQAVISLERLGLGEAARRTQHLAYHGVRSVWGAERPSVQDFLRMPHGAGLHIDRCGFEAALIEAATERGALLLRPARLKSLRRGLGGWRAVLHVPGEAIAIRARVLVDATGRSAAIARRLGRRRIATDKLIARYAYFSAQPDRRTGFTLLEAATGGWWYAAPVPAGRMVVAFHTDSDLAATALRSGAGFRAALSATQLISPEVQHPFDGDPQPRTVAANSVRLDCPAGQHWLAIGDAVLSFDPLSSQGLFNALTTALLARDAIAAHLGGEADDSFNEYARRIQSVREAYGRNLALHYELERRFNGQPFWNRRWTTALRDNAA